MHWLFLGIGLAAMVLAFWVPQTWSLILLLIISLVFILIWARGWYASRVGTRQDDIGHLIDQDELRRLHDLAASRRQAQDSDNQKS